MNIYLVEQKINNGYDTYDSMVVVAESQADAVKISPSGFYVWRKGAWYFVYADGHWDEPQSNDSWAEPYQCTATLLGEAKPGTEAGLILASYNAG